MAFLISLALAGVKELKEAADGLIGGEAADDAVDATRIERLLLQHSPQIPRHNLVGIDNAKPISRVPLLKLLQPIVDGRAMIEFGALASSGALNLRERPIENTPHV